MVNSCKNEIKIGVSTHQLKAQFAVIFSDHLCVWTLMLSLPVCHCHPAVQCNNHYTVLLENVTFYFVLQQVFFLVTLFFPSCCVFFHTFISECDCTPLQCFYKSSIQSNQQVALSQLVYNTHCHSAVFPY
jgi:hypothetical protein